MKRAAIIVVLCLIALVAARKYRSNSSPLTKAESQQVVEVTAPIPRQTILTSLPPLTNLTIRAQRILTQYVAAETTVTTNETNPASAPAKKKSAKPPRQDLLARAALASVGIDPVAEQYWVMAINDPTLGEHEREDLIEDLNEEGFEDPKNPTIEELPIIINRLQIIEEYAPFAIDEVNARSFAEAYKDLVNMYTRLTSPDGQ
jgi:hypothetical protein